MPSAVGTRIGTTNRTNQPKPGKAGNAIWPTGKAKGKASSVPLKKPQDTCTGSGRAANRLDTPATRMTVPAASDHFVVSQKAATSNVAKAARTALRDAPG